MEWLKPFMTARKYRKGDVLIKKGDKANEMFLTVTGKFLVTEIGVELPPGRLMSELGFLAPDNRRTATVECIEDGQVLTITYDKLHEIYFQNPQFGLLLPRTHEPARLMENVSRLEAIVAQHKATQQTAVHLAQIQRSHFSPPPETTHQGGVTRAVGDVRPIPSRPCSASSLLLVI